MTGTEYMAVGILIVILATIGFIVAELLLARGKKQIREKTYQIYK